jgi:ketosteroid isomerase-like protein
MDYSDNVKTVLGILQNEVSGDVKAALQKMTSDYTMTWMYKGKEKLFPSTGVSVESEMNEIYLIQGRQYDIRNITESENIVMVEMIESYPGDDGKMFRTPQVIVLEMEDGKIKKGRHYCDPAISYMNLELEQIEKGLNGTSTKQVIS